MSKYNDISIKKLVDWINNIYLLPDIQRPFVWWDNNQEFEERVCSLFDSILRNYPIWTLLFWKVDKNRMEEDWLTPLKFLDNSKKDKNDEYNNILQNKDYILVLDWQQRMTIFNLVFKWVFEDTYRNKIRKRNLYFNLYNDSNNIENISENLHEFKFFEESNGEYFIDNDNNKLWYKVKDILNLQSLSRKRIEIKDKYELGSDIETIIEENLETLKNSINEENISYYEIEKEKKDEEVLEIFVRVNSKGMVLSYSDLLFSKITQYWKQSSNNENYQNARDTFYYFLKWDDIWWEIKWINRYWEWFDFDNDFILKTSLVLINTEVRYRLKNFNKENIESIKNNWDKITKSIRTIISFIDKIWINSNKLLRSNNSIIPLIYFVYNKWIENKSIELNSKNYELMKKYLFTILINWVFWWQTDQLLTDAREVIKKSDSDIFPLSEIINKLWQKRNIKKNDDIKDLLDTIKYNTDKSKIILSILYWRELDRDYQEDHLFPQKKTKKYCEENLIDKNKVDNISNIQILKNENQIKNDTDFDVYRNNIIKKVPEYDTINYIPTLDNELKEYTKEYFPIFLEKRKIIILEKIKNYFTFSE